MVKSFIEAFKRVRKEAKIKALNTIIEDSVKVRDKAKQVALAAQAKRDALLAS